MTNHLIYNALKTLIPENKNILNIWLMSLLVISVLIFFYENAKSQPVSNYSFYVAGHAYGAHAGKNIGFHPPFLSKLNENKDSSVFALFLTGDIVNQSSSASWDQVEKELAELNLNSYYVMGNHDNNLIGYEVFKKKHGSAYYYFIYKNELYVVLNSTESDRSISPAQLKFLDDIFANTDANWERAFVFFHEVIWNSNEKYKLVRSNSRSRYAQIASFSNFWNEVYPRLTAQTEKQFYLFAGDVGGNTDAIAASYDRWENVTLVSSGMGEVIDENYLKVVVLPDTITFELIALNDSVELKPITWYNIPEKPDSIFGPTNVTPSKTNYTYFVEPVQNATSYKWNFSEGISGNSDSSFIILHFDEHFQNGKISVTAIRDGFGESVPEEIKVFANNSTRIFENRNEMMFEIQQNQNNLLLKFYSNQPQNAVIAVYDLFGRTVYKSAFFVNTGYCLKWMESNNFEVKGLVIIELQIGNKRVTKKTVIN
jgi:hypothetical protein